MRPQLHYEVICLQALPIVLQHPAVAADQQNICRLSRVCKAWQQAVQQSSSCLTDIIFKPDSDHAPDGCAGESAAELVQFAHWVSRYAGVIRSIDLDIGSGVYATPSLGALSQQVLSMGLRAAGTAHHTAEACGIAAEALLLGAEVVLQPLRLRSFQSRSYLTSPLLLSALPAATLTQLVMEAIGTGTVFTGADCEVVGNLSNLKHLQLDSCHTSLPATFLNSISRLTKLTALASFSFYSADQQGLLPQQLLELTMGFFNGLEPLTFHLTHLTQLRRLCIDTYHSITVCALPVQLQHLRFGCGDPAIPILSLTSLPQLQQLSLDNSKDGPQSLLALTQVQQLTDIGLNYEEVVRALAAAPAWPQLQQLSDLEFRFEEDCSAFHMACVVAALTGLSRLTSLSVCCELDEADNVEADALQLEFTAQQLGCICQAIKHLTNLRKLELESSSWVQMKEGDMLHLSNLTGLTSLQLKLCQRLDDTMIIAVLLALPGLQDLGLNAIEQLCALPVIGRLQQLTHLVLCGLSPQQQLSGMSYLTGLRKLCSLDGFECSKTVMKEFWAGLRS